MGGLAPLRLQKRCTEAGRVQAVIGELGFQIWLGCVTLGTVSQAP